MRLYVQVIHENQETLIPDVKAEPLTEDEPDVEAKDRRPTVSTEMPLLYTQPKKAPNPTNVICMQNPVLPCLESLESPLQTCAMRGNQSMFQKSWRNTKSKIS